MKRGTVREGKKKRGVRWLVRGVCGAAGLLFLFVLLDVCRLISPNRLWVSGQYCRGADLSHYQGEVDMKALDRQGIEFVYIKATEGASHQDDRYFENAQNASSAGMLHGAYHFFSFDTSPAAQAQHFIGTVGGQKDCLFPAVDVEYYGDRKNLPDGEEIREMLQEYLDLLEEEYQCKPVIYSTTPFYLKYLKGYFEDYPLWIRNVYCPPELCTGEYWSFWQYDDRTVLDGCAGEEKYIDINVFHGKRRELLNWVL